MHSCKQIVVTQWQPTVCFFYQLNFLLSSCTKKPNLNNQIQNESRNNVPVIAPNRFCLQLCFFVATCMIILYLQTKLNKLISKYLDISSILKKIIGNLKITKSFLDNLFFNTHYTCVRPIYNFALRLCKISRVIAIIH